jgi:FMN phosphatase YigB (HAD superfamily)
MSAPRAPVRAISVDMDGTLYAVRRLRVAWRLRSERGLLVALLAAREKMRHDPPLADREALDAREVELVAPSFGLGAAEARARISALRAAMPDALTRGARPFAGVRDALLAAHVRGVALAVLSDYDPEEKLRNLGLDDLPWAARLSADRCGALKPHARPFLSLAATLGVAPSEVLHVGDREDVDVAGALAAGMRAWRFAPKGKVTSAAERVLPRWSLDVFGAVISG